MALSEFLKTLYSSNTYGKRFYETVELSHSRFTQTYYLVKDSISHNWELENSQIKTFEPFGFSVKLPNAGSNQQDLEFVLDNVSRMPINELELAAQAIAEPIKLTYRVYMDGFINPQMPGVTFVLTKVVATNSIVSAVATRPDLFKRKFPTGNKSYFDSRFKGLYL